MAHESVRVSLAAARPRRPHRLELTALTDLVFILLIFFILETSFIEFRQLDFRQPQAPPAVEAEGQGEQAPAAADPHALEVEVFSSGKLWLNGESLSVRDLAGHLRARNPDSRTPVIVSIEPAVPAQLLVEVLDALHAVRLTRVAVRELGADHD